MQLVSDRVIMFDTMKDKTIGRAEVIEKFGVPPEKVIEVQALIGDSTDNVPGVPGIGVKTAAQLIGEYGDLETLLKRAGEIKQDKRRQTLIDNAEKARLSKKLVTLDTNVKLDVPIGDLAVHEPDHKRLIAFLKAMEFSSLTRRVAEFACDRCGRDRAGMRQHRRWRALPRLARAKAAAGRLGVRCAASARPAGAARRHVARGPARGAAIPARSRRKRSPQRAARQRARRNSTVVRYETVRSLDRLKAWIERARDTGLCRHRHATTTSSIRCRRSCAVSRWRCRAQRGLLRAAIHRQGGDGGAGLFQRRGGARSDPGARSARRLKPLLEDPGVLKIGQNLKFDLADFRRRGIEIALLRRHHADVLCGRCRPRRSRPRSAGASATSITPTIDFNEVTKAGKAKITFERRDRQGDRIRRRRMPTSRCGCGRCSSRGSPPSICSTSTRRWSGRCLRVLAHMERRGISIDRHVLSRLSGEFAQEAAGSKPRSTSSPARPSMPASPKQIGDILFGKMAIAGRHQDQDRPMVDRRARCSKNWPSRATSCRRKFSTGGRSRN